VATHQELSAHARSFLIQPEQSIAMHISVAMPVPASIVSSKFTSDHPRLLLLVLLLLLLMLLQGTYLC
jgi:hypothetical protein